MAHMRDDYGGAAGIALFVILVFAAIAAMCFAASNWLAEHGPGDEEADGEGSETDAALDGPWPFPKSGADMAAPPQSVVVENSRPGSRTARGREKTRAALAKGA